MLAGKDSSDTRRGTVLHRLVHNHLASSAKIATRLPNRPPQQARSTEANQQKGLVHHPAQILVPRHSMGKSKNEPSRSEEGSKMTTAGELSRSVAWRMKSVSEEHGRSKKIVNTTSLCRRRAHHSQNKRLADMAANQETRVRVRRQVGTLRLGLRLRHLPEAKVDSLPLALFLFARCKRKGKLHHHQCSRLLRALLKSNRRQMDHHLTLSNNLQLATGNRHSHESLPELATTPSSHLLALSRSMLPLNNLPVSQRTTTSRQRQHLPRRPRMRSQRMCG